jgi:hypothetical protein
VAYCRGKLDNEEGKQMNNPITKCELFHTPDSMKELQDYIERFTGSERAIAYTIMGITWNLAAKVIDDDIEADVNQMAAEAGEG